MRDYALVTDPYTVQKIRTQRFDALRWSPGERLLKDRPKHVRDFFKRRQVPFGLLCETKFKRSLFGIFLHRHNANEVQDYFMNDNKLAMLDYDLRTYSANELKHLECENNFAPDLRKLLERAVDEREVIDYDFLYDNVYALRFCDTPLTFIDSELKKFRHLKVLILCGNWLTDVPGASLPKSLEYIELFANQVEFLNNFARNGPKRLIHIGLKRNWLTNDSHLHLLGNREKYNYLQSLDLSENDIYELQPVLRALRDLKKLLCLQLQGNPCSVVKSYKDDVLRSIPWLVQLDLTEILDADRDVPEHANGGDVDAGITFTCHRIMGLPKPTQEKGTDKWFYFSIGMPLLEDVIEVKDVGEEESAEEGRGQAEREPWKKTKLTPAKSAARKASRTPSKKTGTAAAANKKGITGGLYNGPDEYADERKRRVVDTTFRTERFAWDKIMQLPEEALVIKSAERNFADIRDTLRSSVCVKLVYLEVRPPEKPKRPAETSTPKAKKPITKDSSVSSLKPAKNVIDATETIVKKITLATLNCDLHSINWSDKTIDFIWAAQDQFKERAQEVEGSLRDINYSDKPKPKPMEKAKASAEHSSVTDAAKAQEVHQSIPKIFTIQVGFGLQRNYYQS